jgi:PLP dependent protein
MVNEQLQEIQLRIADACSRAGRHPDSVRIVAVTKTLGPDPINEAIEAGLHELGENRVQEYIAKRALLQPHRFHMVGHLQKNKVRHIIEFVDLIHSVDSIGLAEEIEKRASTAGRNVDILLEVNTSGEESKHGLDPHQVVDTAVAIAELAHVRIRGLMTVAEFVDNPEDVRPSFARLRELREMVAAAVPDQAVPELSMGMTNDYEVAIEEGATIVRLGTALFGARNKN